MRSLKYFYPLIVDRIIDITLLDGKNQYLWKFLLKKSNSWSDMNFFAYVYPIIKLSVPESGKWGMGGEGAGCSLSQATQTDMAKKQ